MVTIEVNERSKAGKALLATARLLALKNKGIIFYEEDDKEFSKLIEEGLKSRTLTENETETFLKDLKKKASK